MENKDYITLQKRGFFNEIYNSVISLWNRSLKEETV